MSQLSPLQRAYWLGYRRAKAKMRRELHEMERRLDDELVGLADDMQGAHDEFHQYQAVEEAIGIERDPDMLLD
jgi:hypothetical protein